MDIRRIAGALGAEVTGIDVSRLSDGEFAAVHAALLKYGVLVLRVQSLTPAAQLAFARRWGEPHFHPYMPGLPDQPEVIEIVKARTDRHTFGGNWHTDQMFTDTPARVTMLYAKEVPSAGGDTLFASLYGAFDALSPGLQGALRGLRTVNIYDKQKKRANAMKVTAPDEPAAEVEHPLVRVHSETGREALYISYDRITRRIAGMTDDESRPLLDYLCDVATRPELTCRVRWDVGTLVVWDNRSVQHMAINDYHGHRRVMHRITIRGEPTG